MNKVTQWALTKIMDACIDGFYGSVTIRIENGKITTVKTERTHKPPVDR